MKLFFGFKNQFEMKKQKQNKDTQITETVTEIDMKMDEQ